MCSDNTTSAARSQPVGSRTPVRRRTPAARAAAVPPVDVEMSIVQRTHVRQEYVCVDEHCMSVEDAEVAESVDAVGSGYCLIHRCPSTASPAAAHRWSAPTWTTTTTLHSLCPPPRSWPRSALSVARHHWLRHRRLRPAPPRQRIRAPLANRRHQPRCRRPTSRAAPSAARRPCCRSAASRSRRSHAALRPSTPRCWSRRSSKRSTAAGRRRNSLQRVRVVSGNSDPPHMILPLLPGSLPGFIYSW